MDNDLKARFASNFNQNAPGGYGSSSDLRSEFESKTYSASGDKGGFNKKAFSTNALDTSKQWKDGKKGFDTSAFVDAGKKNNSGSRSFNTSEAKEGAMAFAERNKSYGAKSADISHDSWGPSGKSVDRYENSRISNTPNLEFPIRTFREDSKRSIEDVNMILGRSNNN